MYTKLIFFFSQDFSSTLKIALGQLRKQCFLRKEDEPNRQALSLMKRLTPMTYYYVVQSLLSRCAWVDSAVQFISQPTISAPFQLAWRTQQLWLAGKEVLQCWLTCPIYLMKSFVSGNPPLRLIILPEQEARKFMKNMAMSAMPPEELYLEDFHYIDNIQLSATKTDNGELDKVSISFLLAKDHGLSESHCAFAIDVSTSTMVFAFGWMWGFDKTVAKNPHPFEMKALSLPLASTDGLQLLKCIEEKDFYEIVVSTQGLAIEKIEGMKIS